MCPNMHTLHLHLYTVQDTSSSSSSSRVARNSTKASSVQASGSHQVCVLPANGIRTLVLDGTDVLQLVTANVRQTRGMQPEASMQAEQPRCSLPNLTCLMLKDCAEAEKVVAMFGAQLTELHLPELWTMPDLNWQHMTMHLQQLQKLVLPDTHVSSPADMEQLLSLPSLLHLEVDSVSEWMTKAFSRHPCQWQYLHLHLRQDALSLAALAKLPLYSLTHSLILGREKDGYVKVRLPSCIEDGMLADLERLTQQLVTCGVQLHWACIAWTYDDSVYLHSHDYEYMSQHGNQGIWYDDQIGLWYGHNEDLVMGSQEAYPGNAQQAAALSIVAPAFGLHTRVAMYLMVVDQPILKALATVYESTLKQLVLDSCIFQEDMLGPWQVALDGLPSLHRVELRQCIYDPTNRSIDEYYADCDIVFITCGVMQDMTRTIHQLGAAMAQQMLQRADVSA